MNRSINKSFSVFLNELKNYHPIRINTGTFLFAEKIDFFARTPTMCHGQIVRIDSRLVFKNNKEGALHHLSYQLKDRDPSDYVSRKEVKSKEVKAGKNKLWKEDFTGCLEKVTLVHKVDESLNINKLRRNN